MPLMCPECGSEISEGELVCFNCGYLVPDSDIPSISGVSPDGEQFPINGELPIDGELLADEEVTDITEQPNEEEPTDTEVPPPIEGISDESIQRGCLIAVGVVGMLMLVIMIILTFNAGMSR